jgi:aerobic carbon-monoxide dehydrogenase medium subunit
MQIPVNQRPSDGMKLAPNRQYTGESWPPDRGHPETATRAIMLNASIEPTPAGPSAPALAVHRSRKLIQPFTLYRPATVEEAVAMMTAAGPAARPMAGGIDLVSALKFGGAGQHIVHLGRIGELRIIRTIGDDLEIGACVTLAGLLGAPLVADLLPDLPRCLAVMANVRVRWKATVGGNLMTRNPAYDLAPVLAALGASLVFALPGGRTALRPVTDITGPTPGLLTAIRIPQPATARLAYERKLRPALSLAIAVRLDAGKIASGVGAAGCAYRPVAAAPLPIAAPLAVSDLPAASTDIAAAWARTMPAPVGDWVASADYRRRMCKVLAQRLLADIGTRS